MAIYSRKIVDEIKQSFLRHRTYSLAKDQYTATDRDLYLALALSAEAAQQLLRASRRFRHESTPYLCSMILSMIP